LVYANKQDVSSAKPVADLIAIYGLDKIKTHQWHIQPCSAKTGEGLMAGLQWLSDQLVYKKNTRFPNNPYLQGKLFVKLEYKKLDMDSVRNSTFPTINVNSNTSRIISEELKKTNESVDINISK
jgi:hypothetical protein